MRKLLKIFEKTFIAITFAEAGCHDIAREFIEKDPAQTSKKSLNTFLDTVGLKGVNVRYKVVKL